MTEKILCLLSLFQNPPDLVIGTDTIVTQDNVIFEKPKDKNHACEMLKM